MKKKTIAAMALASCLTVTSAFAGCSLVTVNNKADMEQVIAKVDITKSDKFSDSNLKDFKTAVSDTSIYKRDLISYFLNVGYSYMNQNNNSYADTFNALMDALVDNAVLVQYSTLELLKNKAAEEPDAVSVFNSKKTEEEKYEYILGEDSDEVLVAKYNFYSSLNKAIDNYENTIIKEKDEYKGSETRSTPVNLNTEQEDYYPSNDGKLDYFVYTGFVIEDTGRSYLLKDSGQYQDDAIEGTNRTTRVRAYNAFINSLRNNNLIEDGESDKLTDILELKYIKREYVSQLKAQVISKYYDIYEKEQEQKLLTDNYIQNVYENYLEGQKRDYKSSTAFSSAMSNMSDSSFLLYSPSTDDSDEFDGEHHGKFGYVYNILLPFNAKQSAYLKNLQSIKEKDGDDNYYYIQRRKLLSGIKTEDQRSAWFNGETQYAFNAKETSIGDNHYGNSDYLFFEGNLTDSQKGGRYKKLKAYDGRYSYNGQVFENADGSYTLIGRELDIDDMLAEFSDYVNYVLTGDRTSNRVNIRLNPKYSSATDYYKYDENNKKTKDIDYSLFLYAEGEVDLGGEFKKSDLFNAEATGDQYKAMSAVNELQFAYTTDTGVLSQYAGYAVSAYDTTFIKEFEYAAKLAVAKGEGSLTVCAGDYGWHIIYATYVFEAGDTYGQTPDWSRVKEEGTFEYMFFEWVKSSDITDVTTSRRSKILSDYNKTDVTVEKYQSKYQDLLDLGN